MTPGRLLLLENLALSSYNVNLQIIYVLLSSEGFPPGVTHEIAVSDAHIHVVSQEEDEHQGDVNWQTHGSAILTGTVSGHTITGTGTSSYERDSYSSGPAGWWAGNSRWRVDLTFAMTEVSREEFCGRFKDPSEGACH